jgi:hypothetical protein
MREHVFKKNNYAALPKKKQHRQLQAWPLIPPCPVCRHTDFDLIYFGRKKGAHGQAPKASADLSIFPVFAPTGLTFFRKKEPSPRHLY